MNDWLKLITDRIISWPVAVLLIVVVFRRPIRALLVELAAFVKRASHMSVKRGDTTLEARTDAGRQTTKTGDDLPDAKLGAGAAISPGRSSDANDLVIERQATIDYGKGSPSVMHRETAIRTELERLGFSLNEIETSQMLIRQLAASQCIAFFERTYRLIYGSQIEALDFLNANGIHPANVVESFFYRNIKATDAEFYANTTFNKWASFLLGQSLIAEEDGHLGITVQGRDFLVWMVNAGLTKAKVH